MSTTNQTICENLNFATKEAFKKMRTNVTLTGAKTIGITSAQPGDGKSTISVNLAYSLAELGKSVLIIDADMRRASIHDKLEMERAPGLSNLLQESNDVSSALRKYNSSKDETSFSVMPSGDIPHNPSELLNSSRMNDLLQKLGEVYDYIVVDLPPVGAVIDAAEVSKVLDGMVVVVRENSCPRGLMEECIQQLQYVGANILGYVMNGALEGAGKSYQYGKKSYYGYY